MELEIVELPVTEACLKMEMVPGLNQSNGGRSPTEGSLPQALPDWFDSILMVLYVILWYFMGI